MIQYAIPKAGNSVVSGGDVFKRNVAVWAQSISLWESWMRAQGLADNTIWIRRYHLIRLAADVGGDYAPGRVTTETLVLWLGSHRWKNATMAAYTSTFRRFYAWAKGQRLVKADPAAALPSVKVARGLPRPAPDAAWNQAIRFARTDRTLLVLDLLGRQGMRRAEVAVARWDWLIDNTIHVTGKGGKTRPVPLHPDVAPRWHAEHERRRRGTTGTGYGRKGDPLAYLLPGRDGGHVSPRTVGRIVESVVEGWGPHSMRHRFATRALAGSGNLLAVQQLLGHASPDSTQIYTLIVDQQLAAAVAAV